ncbi:DUF6578 domain-containing protein [Nocardiopsis suaedae]|uniref:Uncharacterized protein n=1 Tax=Nocardiopsis suaedae TaxID=3018444 RepID=A0ABT4TF16_9ACTN|nr:DUF6578 domain-containing protein [Nocardiopsis suaedae]MDA2803279.1 hypothetical protein [Nocardiopsis suaedae]
MRTGTAKRTAVVWVENRGLQCCGDPFSVGAQVEWFLLPAGARDRAWMGEILDRGTAEGVTHLQEHHAGSEEPVAVAGTVRRIRVVRCRYAEVSGSVPRSLRPVPDTTELAEAPSAHGWESSPEGVQVAGYLVDLETAH